MRRKRSAQSGTGTRVLIRCSTSAAEAHVLPPNTSMLSTTLDTINTGQRFRPRGPNEGHKQQGEVLNEEPCKHKQTNPPAGWFRLPNDRKVTQERVNPKAPGGGFRCPFISPTDVLTPASAGWGLFPCKVDDTTEKSVKWRFCSHNGFFFFLGRYKWKFPVEWGSRVRRHTSDVSTKRSSKNNLGSCALTILGCEDVVDFFFLRNLAWKKATAFKDSPNSPNVRYKTLANKSSESHFHHKDTDARLMQELQFDSWYHEIKPPVRSSTSSGKPKEFPFLRTVKCTIYKFWKKRKKKQQKKTLFFIFKWITTKTNRPQFGFSARREMETIYNNN